MIGGNVMQGNGERGTQVPEIRFGGFSGEWEEKKLGDICILITKGTTPIDKSGEGNINFIKVENINPLSGNINLTSKITKQEHENNLKRSQLMEGDILFSIAGTLGRITTISKNILPANTNQALAIIRLKQCELGYVTTCLKGRTVSEYIKKNPTVGAQPNLSLGQITNLELSFPNTREQRKIGDFFQEMDRLISQHQQKHDKLLNIKKALLEKMFPQPGKTEPEIRFKGFSGEWIKDTLGNTTSIYDGTHQTPNYTSSGVMFLSVENIKTLQSEKYISKESFEKDFKVYPKKNDVLMTRIGDVGTANVVESDLPKAYYVTLALLKYKNLDPYFLKVSLASDSVKRDIWHRTLHIAFPKKINMNEIAKVIIQKPELDIEQTKIGNFFQQLDRLINQHQTQIQKLNHLKQAFLSKMFV